MADDRKVEPDIQLDCDLLILEYIVYDALRSLLSRAQDDTTSINDPDVEDKLRMVDCKYNDATVALRGASLIDCSIPNHFPYCTSGTHSFATHHFLASLPPVPRTVPPSSRPDHSLAVQDIAHDTTGRQSQTREGLARRCWITLLSRKSNISICIGGCRKMLR